MPTATPSVVCPDCNGARLNHYPSHVLHWSKDGTHLVFNVGGRLLVVDTEGIGVREVIDTDPRPGAEGAYNGFYADLSPNGDRIVYRQGPVTREGRGYTQFDIAIVGVDGTGQEPLTDSAAFASHPVWSPDGTRVAFIRESTASGFPVGLYGPESLDDVRLATWLLASDGYLPRLRIFHAATRVGLFAPVWSPDGKHLAYVAYEGPYEDARPQLALYTVPNDGPILGSDVTRIGDAMGRPSWSPDGDVLAVARWSDGRSNRSLIYTIGADGVGYRELVQTHGALQLAWSPNGQELLIVPAESEPYVLAVDSNDAQTAWLNPTGGRATQAAWSPDGSTIALYYGPNGGGSSAPHVLAVVNRNGSDLRLLAWKGKREESVWHASSGVTCIPDALWPTWNQATAPYSYGFPRCEEGKAETS